MLLKCSSEADRSQGKYDFKNYWAGMLRFIEMWFYVKNSNVTFLEDYRDMFKFSNMGGGVRKVELLN